MWAWLDGQAQVPKAQAVAAGLPLGLDALAVGGHLEAIGALGAAVHSL